MGALALPASSDTVNIHVARTPAVAERRYVQPIGSDPAQWMIQPKPAISVMVISSR
jgi:hypothetical protein